MVIEWWLLMDPMVIFHGDFPWWLYGDSKVIYYGMALWIAELICRILNSLWETNRRCHQHPFPVSHWGWGMNPGRTRLNPSFARTSKSSWTTDHLVYEPILTYINCLTQWLSHLSTTNSETDCDFCHWVYHILQVCGPRKAQKRIFSMALGYTLQQKMNQSFHWKYPLVI